MKLLAFALIGGLGAAVGAVVLIFALIVTGSPSACVDRPLAASEAESEALDAGWRAFGQRAAAGPAQITISELQATSRGVKYVDDKDVPVEELQVHFCPDGVAEATGKIDVAGISTKVVVSGTLDLSGDQPRIEIDTVKAGNLPSFIAKPVVNLIISTGDFRTLDLDENLTNVQFSDAIVVVDGGSR